MTESFDKAIESRETELNALIAKMEEIRAQFVKVALDFVLKWIDATARRYVLSDTDNTLKLGREKISEMKGKVKTLMSQVPQITNEVLSDKELWWHLSPKKMDTGSPYEYYTPNRDPDLVDKGVRRIIGRLGSILSEYGFLRQGENWFEQGSSYYGQNPMPCYPYGLDWSQDMRTIMKQYNEVYKQTYAKYKEIIDLKAQKKTKQATDLWESS